MSVEQDVIGAAVEAANRASFEAVRAGLGGVGVPTRTYDELSDRTRRIRADQIRPTVEAAWPVIAAAVRAQVAEEIAVAIEATTILPVRYDVDRVVNTATRIDAEIARNAAAGSVAAPTEPTVAPTAPADWQAIAAEAVQALRLTREYVGEKTLPAREGWSWFDATNRYRAAAGLPHACASDAACDRRGTDLPEMEPPTGGPARGL